jgi:hypothetical protein
VVVPKSRLTVPISIMFIFPSLSMSYLASLLVTPNMAASVEISLKSTSPSGLPFGPVMSVRSIACAPISTWSAPMLTLKRALVVCALE